MINSPFILIHIPPFRRITISLGYVFYNLCFFILSFSKNIKKTNLKLIYTITGSSLNLHHQNTLFDLKKRFNFSSIRYLLFFYIEHYFTDSYDVYI